MYFAQERTEKKLKMEKRGDSVFSAIESINIAPLNAATPVDIVAKVVTTKAPIVGTNTPTV